jgi:hypothetical protein
MKNPTHLITTFAAVISALAWVYGYLEHSYRYRWSDFWFLVVLYFIPVMLLMLSSLVTFHQLLWRKLLGIVLFLPSIVIWVLYLLLAVSSFKLH